MSVLWSLGGIAVLLVVSWLLSSNRRKFPFRTVAGGLVLQWALAFVVLRTATGEYIFSQIASVVTSMLEATSRGARFVLGNLVEIRQDSWGFVFAATALPSIIVFSSLAAIGYHLGILQFVVGWMGRAMSRFMGVSGAESLSAAANVFLGQTEAPLLVKPYLKDLTNSELMAVMVGGFATVSSGVMASYVAILGGDDPVLRVEVARHFMTACLMSAPASFVVAKIMVPETQTPLTTHVVKLDSQRETRNVVHAAANGASDGLKMALNVAAMLIVFIALVAMLDMMLVRIGRWGPVAGLVQAAGMKQLDLGGILGLLFSPVAYIIGVETGECRAFGGLLGKAMATNEFVAYISLADLAESESLSPRTFRLAMYSLCGFANFSSIGIQIGGIGAIAPERRADLARFGLRAMFAGAIACWMTGCIAATFL